MFFCHFFCFFWLVSCKQDAHLDYVLLEIQDRSYRFNNQNLINWCDEYQIPASSIYAYGQHWVVYDTKHRLLQLKRSLSQKHPSLKLQLFENPFYVFDKEKHCKQRINESSHAIIMTAALVPDTIKQQEYMLYHSQQMELFPEVVKGFCHAGFHRLSLFRQGSQLMLVIRIPEGKQLADINHLTYENNPRVTLWNELMSQYQQSIDEAPVGNVWITFEKIQK